jgi:hypothetical protein
MGAPGVAAIIVRKERDLVAHLKQRGAVDPAHAQSRAALGVDSEMAWNRLERSAVVRAAGPGSYYLDLPSWEARQRRRKRTMAIVLVGVILGALLALQQSGMAF